MLRIAMSAILLVVGCQAGGNGPLAFEDTWQDGEVSAPDGGQSCTPPPLIVSECEAYCAVADGACTDADYRASCISTCQSRLTHLDMSCVACVLNESQHPSESGGVSSDGAPLPRGCTGASWGAATIGVCQPHCGASTFPEVFACEGSERLCTEFCGAPSGVCSQDLIDGCIERCGSHLRLLSPGCATCVLDRSDRPRSVVTSQPSSYCESELLESNTADDCSAYCQATP